ncbi:DUF6904 family protein [Desulfosporosinus sp. SB140]|uniref:DUF6904 family protein n=1 Tax=Desulfosporosinus paludis TaxID=3115649 RepID=UPI00388E7297
MLRVSSTKNLAGITISGDQGDFESLYDSLHEIVGDEEDHPSHEAARLRVLGICYDLRHALMGDREIVLVENGMDKEKMKHMGTITHDVNVYYSINVIWPEMLFVLMALNDFCRFYAYKLTKRRYDMMLDKSVIWDHNLAQIRLFQAEAAKCLQEAVEGKTYSRMINMMVVDYPWLEGYITQYLDVLNVRFLDMDRENRKKNLSIMVKRLTEKGKEYRSVERTILEAAEEYDRNPNDIRLNIEYPDQIDW